MCHTFLTIVLLSYKVVISCLLLIFDLVHHLHIPEGGSSNRKDSMRLSFSLSCASSCLGCHRKSCSQPQTSREEVNYLLLGKSHEEVEFKTFVEPCINKKVFRMIVKCLFWKL